MEGVQVGSVNSESNGAKLGSICKKKDLSPRRWCRRELSSMTRRLNEDMTLGRGPEARQTAGNDIKYQFYLILVESSSAEPHGFKYHKCTE